MLFGIRTALSVAHHTLVPVMPCISHSGKRSPRAAALLPARCSSSPVLCSKIGPSNIKKSDAKGRSVAASVPNPSSAGLSPVTPVKHLVKQFPVSHRQGFPSLQRDFSLIFSRMLDNLGCPLSLDPPASLGPSPPFTHRRRKAQEPLINY